MPFGNDIRLSRRKIDKKCFLRLRNFVQIAPEKASIGAVAGTEKPGSIEDIFTLCLDPAIVTKGFFSRKPDRQQHQHEHRKKNSSRLDVDRQNRPADVSIQQKNCCKREQYNDQAYR